MTKRVEVTILCDPCLTYDGLERRTEVQTYTVGEQSLDLCGPHYDQYLDGLETLLRECGVAVEPKAPATRRAAPSANGARSGADHPPPAIQCPLCEHRAGSVGSLSVHLPTIHQTNMAAIYGTTCPLCAHLSGNTSALSAHARLAHSLSGGIPALFSAAITAGDEHNVVAAQAKRVRRLVKASA